MLAEGLTRQPIEQESCSNTQKMRNVLLFQIKKKNWEVLDICCFVGDIIMGEVYAYLDKIIRPWAPTPRTNFLTQNFIGN